VEAYQEAQNSVITAMHGTGWEPTCIRSMSCCAGSACGHITLYWIICATLQAFGSEHAAVAMSLATLASILRGRQQLEEAVTTINRCVELRRGNAALAKGVHMASALYHQVGCLQSIAHIQSMASCLSLLLVWLSSPLGQFCTCFCMCQCLLGYCCACTVCQCQPSCSGGLFWRAMCIHPAVRA
jgi:hypothetical protein